MTAITPNPDEAVIDTCQRCDRTYGVWWADHHVWNEAVGGDPQREAGGLLCPSCFIDAATSAGISVLWKIVPDDPHCFREDNCAKHANHQGVECCCCGRPALAHEGCDCE